MIMGVLMNKKDFQKSKLNTMLKDIKQNLLCLIKNNLKKFESLKIEELCDILCISKDLYDKRFANPDSKSWRDTPIEQLLEWCYRLDIPIELSLSVAHGIPHLEGTIVKMSDSEEMHITEYTNMDDETFAFPIVNYDLYKYSFLANIESFFTGNDIIYTDNETYDKSTCSRYIEKYK